MKYLPKETCEYLVALGCIAKSDFSWISLGSGIDRVMCDLCLDPTYRNFGSYRALHPAFSLEDILRAENAEKIWPTTPGASYWKQKTLDVLDAFQSHPDTWPEEVARLINPNP